MDKLTKAKEWRRYAAYNLAEEDREQVDCLIAELEAAQELIRKACTTGEDGSPVKYGEFDGDGNYILPKELPNIPGLEDRCERLEMQLSTEEQCAMESGGILSDVCDLVFDDPERAAAHGYKGVHNKIVDQKNRLRLYMIGVGKYCADYCTEIKDGLGPCYTCALGKL